MDKVRCISNKDEGSSSRKKRKFGHQGPLGKDNHASILVVVEREDESQEASTKQHHSSQDKQQQVQGYLQEAAIQQQELVS